MREGRQQESLHLQGRVMIDAELYIKSGHDQLKLKASPSNPIAVLTEQQKSSFWPVLPAFSLDSKCWVAVPLTCVTTVSYSTSAFDSLVLPALQKKQLHSIVTNWESRQFYDFIEKKNRGCVFLLHGPPGTGKTLTAEVVAERLSRPLYSVSVGELGVKVHVLEKNLARVLEVASRWNAVLLLDEADLFMARRALDLERTALVGVFLRLLEYYSGILFLTTNRIDLFEEAIVSRMLMTFEYKRLGQAERSQVWRNLLACSIKGPIEQFDEQLPAISEHIFNGREINRLISLGQMLAASEQVQVQPRHLFEAIETARNDRIKRSFDQI